MSLTRTSLNRAAYAAAHPGDPRPSRFAGEGLEYRAWASRADAWAGSLILADRPATRRHIKHGPRCRVLTIGARTYYDCEVSL